MLLAGVSAVGLVVCWAMLQSSIPQRITVRGAAASRSAATAASTPSTSRTPPSTSGSRTARSPSRTTWTAGSWCAPSDVDWKVFSDVVMYYQNKADHNAEERDRRFNR